MTKSGGAASALRGMFVVLSAYACTCLFASCAASIPMSSELSIARQTYARASASPGAHLVPAAMRKARDALGQAESTQRIDPGSQRARELGTLAYREAKIAEALVALAFDNAVSARVEKEFGSAAVTNGTR